MKSTPSDIYKTIDKISPETLFKERKSKFYGVAFPIQSEDEVKQYVAMLRKKHPSANHVCYAWQLGIEQFRYRANDDGEPNNSAGMPIYGQIQLYALTNVLVAVTRIFGGTKLGVGGLIQAYREAARITLEGADIIEKKIQRRFQVNFEYPNINKVMRIIKVHQLNIQSQKLEASCSLIIDVRKQKAVQIMEAFENIPGITIQELSF